MSSNLQNSIWPNTDGNLGNIKVQIPDGVNTFWTEGDALVHNFVYQNGKLVGFVDTKALIANSSKTTTLPYEYVNISLPSIAEGEMTYNHDQCAYFILNGEVIKGDDDLEEITKKYAGCKTVDDIKAVDPNYLTNDIVDGVWTEWLGDLQDGVWTNSDYGYVEYHGMFNYSNLAEIASNLSSLTNGSHMFKGCYNLTSFTSDLPKLTNGSHMFYKCNNLESFSSDSSGSPVNLSSLTDGDYMFDSCAKLTSFSSDLPNLSNGRSMFYQCIALTSFNSDLPNLMDGDYMFVDCSNLKSFSSDLSSLTNGNSMFSYCSNLKSFSSDLSSLTNGNNMFYCCYLNTASVQNIADTINTVSGWNEIDVGIANNEPNEQEEEAFNTMVSKGWTVYVNGSEYTPTSPAAITTLDETGQEITTPIPYWAKPINSDEKHAQYIDSEGNYYNILGAQFIYGDDISTYGMFTCEEDAATQMRLTKIEK